MNPADEFDFEPPISGVNLSADVIRLREAWDREMPAATAAWAVSATAHLTRCQEIIDTLAEIHTQVVERTDIDLTAKTRWVALLESTARCISLADALIDQLRQGYASETAGTARMLHEALELAMALAVGDEGQAKRWLDGKQYPTKAAQRERTSYFDRLIAEQEPPREARSPTGATLPELLDELADDLDVEIPTVGRALGLIAGRVYGDLSASAHNLRRGFADGISVNLRRFTYGRHPDFRVRSHWIAMGESLVEQAALDVLACLAEIVGVDAVRDVVGGLTERLAHVRASHPLE